MSPQRAWTKRARIKQPLCACTPEAAPRDRQDRASCAANTCVSAASSSLQQRTRFIASQRSLGSSEGKQSWFSRETRAQFCQKCAPGVTSVWISGDPGDPAWDHSIHMFGAPSMCMEDAVPAQMVQNREILAIPGSLEPAPDPSPSPCTPQVCLKAVLMDFHPCCRERIAFTTSACRACA